jgi:hypothetical protein
VRDRRVRIQISDHLFQQIGVVIYVAESQITPRAEPSAKSSGLVAVVENRPNKGLPADVAMRRPSRAGFCFELFTPRFSVTIFAAGNVPTRLFVITKEVVRTFLLAALGTLKAVALLFRRTVARRRAEPNAGPLKRHPRRSDRKGLAAQLALK